jgi:hypothetical protein
MTSTLHVPDIDVDADPLTAALAYAAAGWYVVPVRRGTKHPGSVLGQDWQTQSTRDLKQITAWYAGADHGIALHVGKSGAVAFDGDHPELLGGTALLQAIVEQQPPQQRTRPAEGRCHWLFLMPEGRVVGNGGAGPWGDVRGANGVIIVAPSAHPEVGGLYEWLRTGPVPAMPAYLAATLPDASPGEIPATFAECAAFAEAHGTGDRFGPLDRILATIDAELPRTARHPLFTSWTATAMREALAGFYPAQIALDRLQARFVAAEGRGEGRRRTAAEQGREWQGIVSWAIGQAATSDPDETRAHLDEIEGPVLTFDGKPPRRVEVNGHNPPGAPPVADLTPEQPEGVAEVDRTEIAVQGELHKLRIRAEARRRFDDEVAAEMLAGFDVGTPDEILARPADPPGRVEGLIGWTASTLIVAQRKTGKTTLTLNLARSLILGQPFLGRDVVPIAGRVALLNFEVSARQIATWAREAGIPGDRLTLVNMRGAGNPFGADAALDALAEHLDGVESLIVDPFGAAFTGDNENDAGQVRRWLGRVETFARSRVGVADLLLTAHAGKGGNGSGRGSSALEDWPDTIIRMVADDDNMRVISAIGRDVELPAHELRYDSLTRALTLGEPVDAAVERRAVTAMVGRAVEAVESWPGSSGNELQRRLAEAGHGVYRGPFLAALKQAVGQGLIVVEGAGRTTVYRPSMTRSAVTS